MKPLYDIFSKRKKGISRKQKDNNFTPEASVGGRAEKLQTGEKVIIDYREKNCLVASMLISHGIEVEFRELKVADYIVKDTAIERKTVGDFFSSIVNKRLMKQLEELNQYKNKLLIIEGIEEQELYNDDNNSGMNPDAIRGFLLSVLLKYKIPILFTKDSKDTARFILVLLRKRQKEISLNAKKRPKNKKEQMQFVLESFPGVGPKTAKKLLEKFGKLQNIFNAPQDELKKIIGKKSEIFMLLEEEFD